MQKAIIVSFLYGQEAGMNEIDSIIDETNSDYAVMIKEDVIKKFNKQEYIEEQIFTRAKNLRRAN